MSRKRLIATRKKWSGILWVAGCLWVVFVDIQILPSSIATLRRSELSIFVALAAVGLLVIAGILDYRKTRRREKTKTSGT